ncbi:hypothetical protein [Methylosinus sp. Sm6]|uniref:hypothetical protein n=1 Tax=Methylosinus sp. Sm6 TaxID=2866948 RepID=UPI001C993161|nr:hypothetical protein [Methylosinus sp. Sm6]MBY6239845.1 hypothetical protein [Methylosinus sp. Sm6]
MDDLANASMSFFVEEGDDFKLIGHDAASEAADSLSRNEAGREAPLTPDDSARVTAMAASLPPSQSLADERGLLLALHRLRFPAPDIGRLAPFVAGKARELRETFGLGSPQAVIEGVFFLLGWLSWGFLGLLADAMLDEAEAATAIVTTGREGDFVMTLLASALILANIACGLYVAGRILAHQRRREARRAEIMQDAAARAGEQRSKAWSVYLAMGMGGELSPRPCVERPERSAGA